MNKFLEKCFMVSFAAIILILGWIIYQFHFEEKNPAAEPSLSFEDIAKIPETDTTLPDYPPDNLTSSIESLDTEEEPDTYDVDQADAMRDLDIGSITNDEYSLIFMSMLPSGEFDMNDLYHYIAKICLKLRHTITGLDDLSEMLGYIPASTEQVFLILAPERIAQDYSYDKEKIEQAYNEKLLSHIRNHSGTAFFLTYPYYSLSYLEALSEQDKINLLEFYKHFYEYFHEEPNVFFHSWATFEWLVANPANYLSDTECIPDISNLLARFWYVTDYSDLNEKNVQEHWTSLESLLAGESNDALLSRLNPLKENYSSLNNMDIVFFGDSVIGNYTDTTSIPGVVSGLSGAHTYNLGIGGTKASMSTQPGVGHSMNEMIDAFISKDITAFSGTNAEKGMQYFLDDHKGIVFRKICFVINYGLNDYFDGEPVEYPDSAQDNLDTYKGALYAGLKKLKEAYPVSTIIVNTPNFCGEFQCGTLINSDVGETLADYATAAIETAVSLDLPYLDNYEGLGLNADNYKNYISDETHPNELGRFLIGKSLLKKILAQ